MEDSLLIDAVERFVNGEMTNEERIYFMDLREKNPELDQAVVEQIFFLNELKKHAATRSFKHQLHETESQLIKEGLVRRDENKATSKIVYLWNRYKRTIAVAASIAGVVSLSVGTIISALSTKPQPNIKPLVDKLNQQENKTRLIENKINQLEAANTAELPAPKLAAKFRATGFMIDAANNYIITNAHVVKEAKNQLVVENIKGEEYKATLVYVNPANDIAVLKVTDEQFKKLPALPYSIKKTSAELGEQVYMLGFPKQEIVYGEGYVSARNGYKMDTIYCQLNTSANEGTSGSPVINKNGEVIGIISSMEANADGVVFAIKPANIFAALEDIKQNEEHASIKINSQPTLKGVDRVQQIKKVQDYVFMIKGN
jgi:S1-C subfamily serine protease